jgi:acylphosphatase
LKAAPPSYTDFDVRLSGRCDGPDKTSGMERRRVRYEGGVQGVGFRATACWLAGRHPVTGWVRNEEDGAVLLEAQGARDALDSFLRALRVRMAGNIRHESGGPVPLIENEAAFEIRR